MYEEALAVGSLPIVRLFKDFSSTFNLFNDGFDNLLTKTLTGSGIEPETSSYVVPVLEPLVPSSP